MNLAELWPPVPRNEYLLGLTDNFVRAGRLDEDPSGDGKEIV